MFHIDPNPTFKASLRLHGQGRTQTLNVVYRHKDRDEFTALLESLSKGDVSAADVVLALVESWDADAPLEPASVERLGKVQPGADMAIIDGYSEALTVARAKN